MRGTALLLQKDARVAGTILLPAAILLVVACVAWIAALEMPSVAAALRAFGLAVPSMSARVGYVATFASLATLVLPCCVAAILVHGDRAHGAALTSVTLPAPDTTKAGSKACVMLAAAAACVLACLGLAAWAARQGEPLANVTLLHWHVHPSPLKLLACACISALVGAAAALLVDRLWLALVLSAVVTLAVGMLASFAAYAWFGASWGPWGVQQLFPDADEDIPESLRMIVMPEVWSTEAAAAVLAAPVGIAAAACGVVVVRWRGMAGRHTASARQAFAVGGVAACVGIMCSLMAVRAWTNLDAQLGEARAAEIEYRLVYRSSPMALAVAIAGVPGKPHPEWLPAAQLKRIFETSHVNATNVERAVIARLLGADPNRSPSADFLRHDFAFQALRRRCRRERSIDLGPVLREQPWTQDQRLVLAGALHVAAPDDWSNEVLCELLHALALTTDPQERIRLTAWIGPQLVSDSWSLDGGAAEARDRLADIDTLPTLGERLFQRARQQLAGWLANWRRIPDSARYISDSCLRDAERVLAILEAEQGDPFATSGANAP